MENLCNKAMSGTLLLARRFSAQPRTSNNLRHLQRFSTARLHNVSQLYDMRASLSRRIKRWKGARVCRTSSLHAQCIHARALVKDGLPQINCPYSSTGNASQESGSGRFAAKSRGFLCTCIGSNVAAAAAAADAGAETVRYRQL